MAISKENRVSKDAPCRHCGKPDWCLRFEELEVCARGMIADGWERTNKATSEGHSYLRRVPEPKALRPIGKTFFHEYRTDDGRVFKLKREYLPDGKKRISWVHPLGDVREVDLLPYAWEKGKDHELLFFLEGELCVDDAWKIEIPAISIRGKTLSEANIERLKGKTIVICPDRDKTGVEFAQKLYKTLKDVCSLKLALLPPSDYWWHHLPATDGLDIWDFMASGATKDDVLREVTNDLSFISSISSKVDVEETSASSDLGELGRAVEPDEEHQILASETRSLLAWSTETIEIDTLVPSLAEPFKLLARAFNIPEVIFVAAFLPIGASLLSLGTKIEIAAGTGFYPPPVVWIGIVGESGSTKSPVFKILMAPLKALQAEAEEIYKRRQQAYEIEYGNYKAKESKGPDLEPEKPTPRNYYFHDFTAEAIAMNMDGATNGSLVAVDELEEMLAGFNQYRKGKGNDRQKWLSIYDSGSIKVDRGSGKRMFLSSTPVSLLGTIQPEVLKEEMGDFNFVDGLWQRFLWVRLPLTKLPPPQETLSCDISQLLQGLYRRLEQLPPVIYKISPDARKLWNEWHEWCEDYKLSEPHPSIRALYPKARERAARIALILHIVDAVIDNRMPGVVVPAETIGAAIGFVRWSINQTRILYADLGLTDHEQSSKIIRFVERFHGQEVDAYRVRAFYSSYAKPTIKQCREFMQKLVSLGYAWGNEKEGKEYKITLNIIENWSIGQLRSQTAFLGQKTGQSWSTLVKNSVHKSAEVVSLSKEGEAKIDHKIGQLTKIDHKIDQETRPQTTVDQLTKIPIDKYISVGDKVHYVGQEEARMCADLVLTVKAIVGDIAIVSCSSWLATNDFPLQDLQKV